MNLPPENANLPPENPPPAVEHHWHAPTTGQVHKALLQHLHDLGIGQAEVAKVIETKLTGLLERQIADLLQGPRFAQQIRDAVAAFVLSEKSFYDRGGRCDYRNRLRDLIQAELVRQLAADYEVVVRSRGPARRPADPAPPPPPPPPDLAPPG